MRKTGLALLVTSTFCATGVHANPLTDAAEDVAGCRQLSNPEVRLACYDAAAVPLARALESTEISAAEGAESSPESPETDRSDPAPSTSEVRPAKRRTEPDPSPDRGQPSVDPGPETPEWAAAPGKDEETSGDQPDEFTATIVRIKRNNVGRHYFYTDDGAVWMQTQIREIRPPDSLPAEARFERRLMGNPTIKFEASRFSHRVRRIE